MGLRDELHTPTAQRRVGEGDVGDEVVDERRRVVELAGLGDAQHDHRRATLEKGHSGDLKEEWHAERVTIEADGAVEILRADEDLADRGEAEWLSGGRHVAPSTLREGRQIDRCQTSV